MEKQEVTDPMKVKILVKLTNLQKRLKNDVESAFIKDGDEGEYRLKAWIKAFKRFAEEELPNELKETDSFLSTYGYRSTSHLEDDYDVYRRSSGAKIEAYLKSLLREIKDGEYDFTPKHKEVKQVETTPKVKSKKVFIVHGHDEAVKERTARFLDKIGYEAMILHELPSMGKTIIEKIEHYAQDTNFAIVLYTPDDKGETAATVNSGDSQFRARQNVIFEHGYLIGLLKRENVTAINVGKMELPSDIHGMVYIGDDWKTKIAVEMKQAGYDIDMNKLY